MRAIPLQILVAAAAALPAAAPAQAEIKEYQIARMLNFRTECRLLALKRLEPGQGEVERFFGECANRTSYPDGLEVGCPEENDEWACKVLTVKRSFEHLDMLRREP